MATQVAPSKAIISSVGGVGNGGSENSTKPSIIGTAGANVTVNIYDGVRLLGTAIASSTGAWTFTPAADIKLGKHSFTAIAVSSTGTYGVSSEPVSVTVGSAAPAKPVVSGLTDDTGHAIGSPTNDPRPNMSGTGTPTDIITMYDGSTPIASTTVNPDGTWSLKPTSDLPSGTNDIYVIETPAGGGTGTPSDHYPVIIDTHVPATPAAPALKDDSGATIAAGSTSADAHPNISGTGTANDIIKVYDGSNVIGSVKIGPDGTWSFKPTTDLSNGTHDLYVTETTPAGTASAASPHTAITVNTSVPSTPAAPVAKDDSNNVIAAGSTTADAHPTLSGTGTANDIIKVYDGANLIGSVAIGSDGKWSFKPSTDLSTGVTHNISVTESNLAGTTSAHSPNLSLAVDTRVPAKPPTPVMTDDNGTAIVAGSTSSDAHPNMTGTGTAGDIIKVYDGANVIGSVKIDPNGNWAFTPAANLSDGTHDLYVTETTPAGTASAPSDHTAITVDAYIPAKPVITGLTDDSGQAIPSGSTTTDQHPTANGVGKAGDTITLYDNGFAVGSMTITNSDGSWSIKPAGDLSGVNHSLYVVETSPTGKASASSDMVNIALGGGMVLGSDFVLLTATDTGFVGAIAQGETITHSNVVRAIGTAVPNARIVLMDSHDVILGSVTADSSGNWYILYNVPVGVNNLHIATLENGLYINGGAVSFVYDPSQFSAPQIGGIINTVPSVSPSDWLLNGGSTGSTALTFNLLAGPNTDVRLYDNGVLIEAISTDEDGRIRVQFTNVSYGLHTYTLTTIINGVESAPSAAYGLNVVQVDAQPVNSWFNDLIIMVGDTPSGLLLDAGTTTQHSFLLSGTSAPYLNLQIMDNGKMVGTVTAGYNGKWSATVSVGVGQHYLAIHDTRSNTADVGRNVTVTAGVTNVPELTGLQTIGNNSILVAYLQAGSTTTNVNENLFGAGPANTIVNLYDGATLVKTGTTDASGSITWALKNLGTGAHDFSMTSVIGGVESAHSTHFALTVNSALQSTYNAALVQDVTDDQAHASALVDSTSQVEHHTAVGEQDTFKGSSTYAHETVDLNVDPATYFKQDTAHIEGAKGVSIDTLHLTGDHQVLDLTSLTGQTAAAKISGIEVVDLGGHTNTVKLSLVDVLNLGETDLFQTDGKQQMMVKGSTGDSVDLSNSHIAGLAEGEWQAHGTTQVGGVTYNVYEHSGVHTELLVQQGVQIVVH